VATHVKIGFKYTSGQNSSLGIGISGSGDFGTFKATGTNSVSASSTQTFPSFTSPGKYWFRTAFKIAHYRKDCTWGMPIKNHYRYMVKSTHGKAESVSCTLVPRRVLRTTTA